MGPNSTTSPSAREDVGRDRLWLLAGMFTIAYGTNVSTPLLVLYRDRLGLGDGRTMAIFVAYVGGILVTLLVAGPLSDRVGRRAVCLPAMMLSGAASVVLIFGRDALALLIVGRALLGVASGAFLGVGAAWLQEVMGQGTELRAAALTATTMFVGFGAGPMSSAILDGLLPWPLVLPLAVHAVLVVAVTPGVFTVAETRPPSPRATRRRIELGVPTGHRRQFLGVLAPVAFWVFAFPSNSFALFPVLLRDATEGFEVLVAGLSAAFTAWAALLSRPVIARLGARRSIPPALAAGVVGLLLGAVSFSTDWWPLLLPAAALLGCGSGVLMTGGLAITSEIADPASRGALTSTFYVCAYVGMAMPLVVTSLGYVWSTSTSLLVITGVATAAGIIVVRELRALGAAGPERGFSPDPRALSPPVG